MKNPVISLARSCLALAAAACLPYSAMAQDAEPLVTFLGDSATHLFGSTGVADTEIKRTGTASWRTTYGADDWAPHAIATPTTIPAQNLLPYAGSGWFEFYYRSDTEGTIRFIPLDSANQPLVDPADIPVEVTQEWTQVIIPFNGFTREVTGADTVRNFMIRGWGDMGSAVVHYDDIAFMIPVTNGQALIQYASSPIIIDGLVDEGYGDEAWLIATPEPDAEPPASSDLAVNWVAAFDADNLYIVVEVTDDTLVLDQANSWTKDGIEIFFDGDNSKGTSTDSNDIKLAFVPMAGGGVEIITGVFPPNPPSADFSGVQAASSFLGTGTYQGYRIEAKIPLALLEITAEDGWEFGIDFQINDNDTAEDGRDHLFTWFGSDLNNNMAGYGTATLGEIPAIVPVTGVTLDQETLDLATGTSGLLIATVSPSNATSAGISWTSSDTDVVTVSPNGTVSAVGAGEATVTVTTDDGGFTDTAEITVVLAEGFENIVGATPIGDEGLYESPWFGRFYLLPEYDGWIWHEGLNWLYAGSVLDSDTMWFWSPDFNDWVYTSGDIFPHLWTPELGWVYFALSGGVGYHYDYEMDRWYRTTPLEHPYLYFSAADIPAIRERMDHPAFAARRARLMNKVNALLNQSPGTNSRVNQGNAGLLAFAYVITGDEDYAERAIAEALASSAVSPWITGHSFNRGADLVSSERSTTVALVYDWCYDVMTDQQRATLREHLIEKGIKPYLQTIDPSLPDNWYTFHPINNWRGVSHGGSGLGALAIYYESPLARRAARASHAHLPPALLDVILPDSGGHEGVGYNNYGVEYALMGITAHQRFFGGHEDVLRELADDRLGAYWDVYLHAPDYKVANFGRHPDWNTGLFSETGAVEGGPTAVRAALFDTLVPGGDELLRWAGDNGGQRFYWDAASPFYFLWRRDAPSLYQEERPPLQDVVLFRGAGHAVFQSEDLYLALNGGGVIHNRGDLGAFVLVAGNERLIALEPSLNYLGSEFQSTFLANGVGQVTGGVTNLGEYLRFGSGDGFHYLASKFDLAYAGLNRAMRQAVMVRGKYIVLLDQLRAPSSITLEARFQSAFDVQVVGGAGKVLGQQHDLHIVSAGFDTFTFSQGTGGALKHLSLKRSAQEATLLTVLYPVNKGGAAPVVSVDEGTVTITHGDESDELVFAQEEGVWFLQEVNGEDATGLTDFEERNIVPYRDGRDDSSDVPSWLLETVR